MVAAKQLPHMRGALIHRLGGPVEVVKGQYASARDKSFLGLVSRDFKLPDSGLSRGVEAAIKTLGAMQLRDLKKVVATPDLGMIEREYQLTKGRSCGPPYVTK